MKISSKNLTKVRKELDKKNKEFEALSTEEKRVVIAKDVIKQIGSGKLQPGSAYLRFVDKEDDNTASCLTKEEPDRDLADITSQTECRVCGIGALFVAAVEREKRFRVGDGIPVKYNDNWVSYHVSKLDMIKALRPYFDQESLLKIERFFERWSLHDNGHPIMRCGDAADRMKMIMQNIIDNNGEFKP